MRVKDLITRLGEYNPEARVIVHGYEGGFDDVTMISLLRIKLNVNPPDSGYFGVHDTADYEEKEDETAILLGREDRS